LGYKIIFKNDGREIETIGWNGSISETRELARGIGLLIGAEVFRITDLTTDEEVSMEQRPFRRPKLTDDDPPASVQ
jgi:hypothetical protein